MEGPSPFRTIIIVTSFFLTLAVIGFILSVFGFATKNDCVITVHRQAISAPTYTGATMMSGLFEARIVTVPTGTFHTTSPPHEPTYGIPPHTGSFTDPIVTGVTLTRKEGQWTQIGAWCMIQISIDFSVVPTSIPTGWPAADEEARLVFDLGEMWPLPETPDKANFFKLWMLNQDDLAMVPHDSVTCPAGQMSAIMLDNGVLALTVLDETDQLEPFVWESPRAWVTNNITNQFQIRCSGWYKVA